MRFVNVPKYMVNLDNEKRLIPMLLKMEMEEMYKQMSPYISKQLDINLDNYNLICRTSTGNIVHMLCLRRRQIELS